MANRSTSKGFFPALDAYFGVSAAGSTFRREVIGGMTTFATMSYIIFVQPTVLVAAGMDFGSVLLATCLSSASASILMGLYAKYPFALAPGMGQNFLFAFTICSTFAGGMGFSWRAGLAMVLIAGLLFLALSIFKTREKIVDVLPDCLKFAIGPAIGLFIAFVGFQWGGIIVSNPATMVRLGNLHSGPALLTILGVLTVVVLTAHTIRGGILIGILVTAGMGIVTGVIPKPTEQAPYVTSTFFALEFGELFRNWDDALIAIGLLFFLDLFDTVGSVIGVSQQAGFMDEKGKLPRVGRVFQSDAAGTCFGALFGTSTVTTYIESATGVAAGARTGLAAVVTGLCFIAALVLRPVIQIAGQDIGPAFYGVDPTAPHVAMYPAVAPALIFVGFMMMRPLRRVNWDDVTESVPAFLTIAMMAFGYGITEGVSMGCISFALVKLLAGKFRDVHPAMYVIAAAFVARYAFLM